MRNRIAHGYDTVDDAIVFGTLRRVTSYELGRNFAERPWRKIGKSSKDSRHRKCQVLETVAAR